MHAYTVIIPAHLHSAYSGLTEAERSTLGQQLLALAEASSITHDAGAGDGPWSALAGLSAGDHQRLAGAQWLSYCIRPEHDELLLLDFGDAHLPSRTATGPRRASDWRQAGAAEEAWSNEGGFDRRADRSPTPVAARGS